MEEVINDPDKAGLSGRKKTVTILFSDIMGFTSISERHTPEQVVALLNEYFNVMTEVIFKWDGTLDKFVGDEIMAFWGAPVDQPDHAERAVRCALDMVDRLALLQKKWASEAKEVLKVGIGINTGEVIIGNIGAEGKKMDYTAIGDPVNTAARVENLTRNYNVKILITETTASHIEALINKGAFGHATVSLAELLDGLVTGSHKVRGQRAYFRALAGFDRASPGGLEADALQRAMQARLRRDLRDSELRRLVALPQASFESSLAKKARALLGRAR